MNQLFRWPNTMPPQHTTLPIQPFRCRMYDQVGAKLHRQLPDRCGKTIVHAKNQPVFFCEVTNNLQVDQIQSRVCGCFQKDHFCIGPDSRFPGLRIACRYITVFNAVIRQDLRDHGMCTSEDGAARQKMITCFQKKLTMKLKYSTSYPMKLRNRIPCLPVRTSDR